MKPPLLDVGVSSVDDLRVMAKNPPTDAVRVHVAADQWIDLGIPPAARQPFEHLVVMRRNMLTCIHGQTAAPPWASLTDSDVVLASVRMPVNTSTVKNAQIVDRRAFK